MNAGRLLLWENFAIYTGPSFPTTRHSHFYAQLVIGLKEKVRIAGRDGKWNEYAIAWIPSGLSHQTEAAADGFCILQIDPVTSGFSPAVAASPSDGAGAFELEGLVAGHMRAAILDIVATPAATARAKILDILLHAAGTLKKQTDSRVLASIEAMLGSEKQASLAELARARGISPSRFRHLFRDETGITFSGYCLWLKTRVAIMAMAKNSDKSRAAFAAGFADQAHFSRTIRRSFGLTPTGFIGPGLDVRIFDS